MSEIAQHLTLYGKVPPTLGFEEMTAMAYDIMPLVSIVSMYAPSYRKVHTCLQLKPVALCHMPWLSFPRNPKLAELCRTVSDAGQFQTCQKIISFIGTNDVDLTLQRLEIVARVTQGNSQMQTLSMNTAIITMLHLQL